MGIDQFHRTGGDDYTPSIQGDANLQPEALPLVDMAQLRQEMEAMGHDTNIVDPHTGEVIDRPAARTPMDDMIDEDEGMR